MPSPAGAAAWINGEPRLEELRGLPIFVHFWSISCYICHDVVDQVNSWRDKYGAQGLAFVSIHQPRGPEELDIAKVTADALGAMKMTQPCAIDNDHALVGRFENQFVPAYYIFNREHQLRHFQAGDKGYDRIESAIARVIDEPAEQAV
ncbi:MAG: TlpA family protein disulfide reductase [Candidatus Eremiobacteraeota bacterium]|nr:TlpA family protein disulfide reductase [Candidatus Eremiobacteraeota bacterium]